MAKVDEFWQGQDPKAATMSALPIFVEECFRPADEHHPPVDTQRSFEVHVAWCRKSNITPLGKIATPDDVAQAVVALLENDLITGQDLVVDGGKNVLYHALG